MMMKNILVFVLLVASLPFAAAQTTCTFSLPASTSQSGIAVSGTAATTSGFLNTVSCNGVVYQFLDADLLQTLTSDSFSVNIPLQIGNNIITCIVQSTGGSGTCSKTIERTQAQAAPTPTITIPTGSTRVDITNGVCSPSTLTIKQGGSITWVNNDAVARAVYISNAPGYLGTWVSQTIPAGQVYTFTFNNLFSSIVWTCPGNQLIIKAEAAPTCTAPPQGMTAWWSFDAKVGINFEDSVNKNIGVVNGNPQLVSGMESNAVSFDGIDDWISVADSPSLDIPGSYAYELWIKMPPIDINRVIMEKQVNELFMLQQDPAYQQRLWFGHRGEALNPPIYDNKFHHLAIVHDQSLGRVSLYIDGNLFKQQDNMPPAGTNNAPLTIGARVGGTFAWKGVIDELAFYNKALSASEVKTIFDAGSAGKCKAPPAPPADTTPPTITCPQSQTATSSPFAAAGQASDASGIKSVRITKGAEEFVATFAGTEWTASFPLTESNSFIVTATDNANNVQQCTFTITYQPAPEIGLSKGTQMEATISVPLDFDISIRNTAPKLVCYRVAVRCISPSAPDNHCSTTRVTGPILVGGVEPDGFTKPITGDNWFTSITYERNIPAGGIAVLPTTLQIAGAVKPDTYQMKVDIYKELNDNDCTAASNWPTKQEPYASKGFSLTVMPAPTPTISPTDVTLVLDELELLKSTLSSFTDSAKLLQQQFSDLQKSLLDLSSALLDLTNRVTVLEGAPAVAAPAPAPAIVAAPVLRVLTPTIESTQQNPVQISFVVENFKVEDGGNHLHFVLDDLGKVNKFSQQQLKDMMPTLVDNTVSQFGIGGLKMPMLLDSAGGVRLFMHYSNEPYKLPDLTDGKYLLRAELADKNHNSLSPAVESLVPFSVKAPIVAKPAVVEVPRPFNFVLTTDELGSERERIGGVAKTGDTLVLRNTGNRELTLWTSATTQPFKIGAGQASTQITLEPAGTFTLVIPENDLIYKIPVTSRACNEQADCTRNEKCTGNTCKPIEGTCTGGIKRGQCSGNRVCMLRDGAYSLLEDAKCQQQLIARDSLFEPTGPYLVLRKTGTISFMKQPRFDRGLKSVPGAPQSFETPIIAPGSSATVSGLQPGRIPFGLNEEINTCKLIWKDTNTNHCGIIIVMEE